MKTTLTRAFTLVELLIAITVIAILAAVAVPAYTSMSETQQFQMKGVGNCKQIIIALKIFSKDYGSQYPDTVQNPVTGVAIATNANDAFRFLIQEQIVTDERIFGCPAGFSPDNNIGQAPGYTNALTPGENHWALTGGQTDTSVGSMPLVFENPSTTDWPPKWNADVAGQIQPGRTWPGGQIIIGRNDGSVSVENLAGDKGKVGPRIVINGNDIFTESSKGLPERILPVLYSK
ncbi:type II secretion system protein [Prosthecobacter sp.]|uniref:type II secretion system protein n=1 Tax=Prosthecobacter sp. TaxID=1965333 RepID=UPI003784B407